MRPMRESDVEFARQQVARNKTLLTAGAISQREVEQFEAQLRAAEAQLKALDEQIRQQRSQLDYYRVTAPIAGTVGDIPVNAGDRVTRTTVLTTVDENDVLEVYINVPVQQAPQLKLGLPVRLVDDRGKVLATNKITFVSPNVDTATQSVLAKAQLVEGRGQFRSDQFVRARVVWTTAPGLTIPVTAVIRINAQFFAFVAEKTGQGLGGQAEAGAARRHHRQRLRGAERLAAGEQLIVSGLQKIRDGAPVMPAPPAAATATERREEVIMIADVFIRRPVLSTVCSLLIILAGAVSIPTLPIARYPDLAPPSVTVSAFYTGANAQAVESAVTTPLEQAINGVEGMSYMTSSSTNSGFATITVTFDVDRNQDLAAVDVQNRVNQALGRMPAEVRQNGISVVKVATGFIGGLGFFSRDNRYSSQFISNYIDLYIRDAHQARAGRRRCASCSASASSRCGCGSIRPSWPAATSPPATC